MSKVRLTKIELRERTDVVGQIRLYADRGYEMYYETRNPDFIIVNRPEWDEIRIIPWSNVRGATVDPESAPAGKLRHRSMSTAHEAIATRLEAKTSDSRPGKPGLVEQDE